MQNVGTAYAVKRAVIDGEPLTERVVTLTGEAVTRPGNVWARLGTPVRHLLNDAGFCPSAEPMVIMGGPLMGFTLPWLDVPVVKITNCLLAPSASEMGEPQEEKGCIRCSACADACPADLLPQQLYWFSKGQQHDKATAHNLADCIECGACAWVCQVIFRWCSTSVRKRPRSRRFVRKSSALRKPKPDSRPDRRARSVRKPRAPSGIKAAVQPAAKDREAISAATARVRDKQRDAAQPIVIRAGAKPDNSEAIAAREARKAEARARKAQQQAAPMVAPAAEPVDPRKAAVEAAIARAKARKAEQQAAPVDAPAAEPVDPRKAAVEAAIARAKARKAEQQAAPVDAPTAEPVDPRKVAVEAAIARAKARKAEQQAAQQDLASAAANDDPRKAAVAAAIARVQARKATQQAVNEE